MKVGNGFISFGGGGGGGGGGGSVVSVGLSAPSEFIVSGSPVTLSGTLTFSKANQLANTVWAGATGGGAAQPSFRALVVVDLPIQAVTNEYVTTQKFSILPSATLYIPVTSGYSAAFEADTSTPVGRNMKVVNIKWYLSRSIDPSGGATLTLRKNLADADASAFITVPAGSPAGIYQVSLVGGLDFDEDDLINYKCVNASATTPFPFATIVTVFQYV